MLELLLKHYNIDVNQMNYQNKKTALIIAVELGFGDVVSLLLKHPQTLVNMLDSHSESALQKAVARDFQEIYELLLRCPKIQIPVEHDSNVMDDADILEKGPTCCISASSVLLAASLKNDFRAIRGILQCPNADINTEDNRRKTPIYLSSEQGHQQSVHVLLNNSRLEVNRGRTKDGSTAFTIASEKSHFEVMKILIGHEYIDFSAGWCKDIWAPYKSMCIVSESRNVINSSEAVQLSPNTCTNLMNTTTEEQFISAAQSGDILELENLLNNNISSELINCHSANAFILASSYGQNQIVQTLFKKAQIDLNKFDETGKTALFLASQNNHINVIELLLDEEEIDVNLAELKKGETPLFVSSKNGHLKITRLLLNKTGIDVNKYTIERVSPLIAAASSGYKEILRSLLAHPDFDHLVELL